MVRDPVRKFVSRYHYNRWVNIYHKLVASKSPVINYGAVTEQVSPNKSGSRFSIQF